MMNLLLIALVAAYSVLAVAIVVHVCNEDEVN